MPSLFGFQVGVAARALEVFHIPPPAAPINMVQLAGLPFGATAIAVARPEKIVPAEAPVDSDATKASAGTPLGPTSCHACDGAAAILSSAFAALAAFVRWTSAITVFGYAMLSYLSCSGPFSRDPSPDSPRPRAVSRSRCKVSKRDVLGCALALAWLCVLLKNELAGSSATSAMAAAAEMRVSPLAKRRKERKRFG